MGLRNGEWSGMFKWKAQGVELYKEDEGGFGRFERVASGAFTSVL